MLLNFHDYRTQARRRLPRFLFEYIDRGAEDETAPRAHRADLDALRLLPDMLTGHAERDLSVNVLGRRLPLPLIVAPTALAGFVLHDGEIALARAAETLQLPYCVSTQSVTAIEAIRAGAPGTELWFQLYVWKNRAMTDNLLDRVRACGIETLVVTADTPVLPNREYNERNGFTVPLAPSLTLALDLARHPGWSLTVLLEYLRRGGMPGLGNYPDAFRNKAQRPAVADDFTIDLCLSWQDISAIRRIWPGQLLVKGLVTAADAERAAELGVDGIVVSTHGARNLDSIVSTARALPPIVDAISDRILVLADSCIQRGSDAVKYMALGARAVMVGRAPLWGLAANGQQGAEAVLSMLGREIDLTLALLGRQTMEGLESSIDKEKLR